MSGAHIQNEMTDCGKSLKVTRAIARFTSLPNSQGARAMKHDEWIANFGVEAMKVELPSKRTVASVCAEHGGSETLAEALRGLAKAKERDDG